MAGIKLSISRSNSKQVVPQGSNASMVNKASDTKKSKKSIFKSSRQGSKQSSKKQETQILDESDATDRTDFSEFTLEDGLFSGSVDKTRRSNGTTRPILKELDDTEKTRSSARRPGNRHGSWIDSTWDGGSFNFDDDNESADELDDSLYQLLDDDMDSPDQFKKLSLHNILVEEELSFQRSLVWNDEEK